MRDRKAQSEAAQSAVRHYVELARAGQPEPAFFGLIDLDRSALLPILEQEICSEQNPAIRALLVKVVWNSRSPAAIPFLAEALCDADSAVSNEALDGLVALASPDSGRVVESAIASETNPKRRILLQEALEQIHTSIVGA